MKVRRAIEGWALALLFVTLLSAQTTFQLLPQANKRVNSDANSDANYVEPAIADNPNTAGNLIIASNNPYKGDSPQSKTPAWISTNNGQIWSAAFMPNAEPGGIEETGGNDPSVVFSRDGLGLATHLSEGASGPRIAGALSLSGSSWSGAGYVIEPGDLMFLSVGPDYANPNVDAFYLSWGGGGVLKLRKSSDGVTWNDPVNDGQVNASSANGAGFAHTAIGPNGEIYYVWEKKDTNKTAIWFQASYDGGSTWLAQDLLPATTDIRFDPAPCQTYCVPAAPQRGVGFSACIAVNRSVGTRGQVYIVYMDQSDQDGDPNTNHDDTDIFFVASGDINGDGKPDSWTTPKRVNDDGPSKSQFLPAMDVDQTTGNIAISWYDARNSGDNTGVEYFATISSDGGSTFYANVKVSAGMSREAYAVGRATDYDFGEYSALVYDKNTSSFHVAWADNSDSVPGDADTVSTFDIYTARVDVIAQP